MRTQRLNCRFELQILVLFTLILAMLLPGLALADGPEPKTPDQKPAAEKADSKAPAEKPTADKPENKPAGKKPDAKAPEDKPADEKPEAKPAAKEPPKEKDADEKPKPEPPPKKKPVDVDLTLMGEYVGTVTLGPNTFRQVGLQVRSTGRGSFEAAQYMYGLPKLEARDEKPTMLMGRRNEDFLVLSGGPWAVLVEPERCLVMDRNGKQVGRLEPVERQSPTLGAKPPKHAVVLFDGTGTEQFTEARMTDDGLLMQGALVKPLFHDFNLHVEFMIPYMPTKAGQGRGNSGVYLQCSYEVQVLDSFALEPQYNDCGALYKFREPDVNMSYPPLAWQTYDIMFTSPRWNSDGTRRKSARITVWHNGVKIHDDVELPSKTGAGKPEEPVLLPIRLQDHGDPVRFRNIWLIDRGDAPPTEFPPHRKPAGSKN